MQILPDILHDGYTIRVQEHIDIGNWAYSIYRITEITGNKAKWKRVRAMENYIKPEAATQAAKNYIDNYLKRKPWYIQK